MIQELEEVEEVPYERKAIRGVKVKDIIKEIKEKGILDFNEPCNCKDKIKHDHWGYHNMLRFSFKDGKFYRSFSDTIRFSDWGWCEWRETDENDLKKEIRTHLNGYW
jgi:hypothetical protein